jgi:hypothetical protein
MPHKYASIDTVRAVALFKSVGMKMFEDAEHILCCNDSANADP